MQIVPAQTQLKEKKYAHNINRHIHSQIQTFLTEGSRESYEHDNNFDLDVLAQKMHPKLWEEICLLTR